MSPGRAQLLVGCAGAAFGAGASAIGGQGVAEVVAGAILGAALGAVQSHPRRAWLFAAAVIAAAGLLSDSLPIAVYFLAPVYTFCAGRWDTLWGGGVATATVVGAWELGVMLTHDDAVPGLLIPTAAWIAGRALREREQITAQLAERARELEEERDAHAALSVRYERARIASELHDIVAHAISVMVVQASAGQRLAAHDPELTAETFEAIAGAARQAEEDMGRLVALLGDEDAIGEAPDLALIEELVARAGGSGLDVTLRLEGQREGFPAPIVETAYRVVQEGLTNALRYASGATVSVLVRGRPDSLLLQVENAPAAGEAALVGAGTGHGLRGLRERVGACGGTFDAGPRADGGWRLSVHLSAGQRPAVGTRR